MQTAGLPVHVSLPVHGVGHVTKLPHPSLTLPHMGTLPAVVQTGFGTHAGCPHTEGTPPPPHVSGLVHPAGVQV